MRILLVNTGCFPIPPEKGGGQEFHVYNLAVSLAGLGHTVHVVSDVANVAHIPDNITLHKIKAPPASFRGGIFGLMNNETVGGLFAFKSSLSLLIRQCDIDVVHIHGRLAALLIALLKTKVPLVYTLHDSSPWECAYDSLTEEMIRKIAYANVEARICRRVDRIIAVSKTIRDDLISRWNIYPEKVVVVPNGVDVDYFGPNNKSDYYLFVGQLTKRKGVEYLIYATHDLSRNLRCIIVGEGPEKPFLTELASKLDPPSKIIFTGSVPTKTLRSLYASASFFVLPSTSEGLPLTILEAMGSGCPVIASRVSGVVDVIEDGCNGFLVEPRDVRNLHDRMEVLAGDPELRAIMGKRARETVERKYSWKSVAERVVETYNNALSQ